MKQRLSKVMAQAGVASRRACEEIIFAGRVIVNGEKILKPEHHVDPKRDAIEVDGLTLQKAEEKVYFILNKPRGFICSARQGREDRLVVSLFDDLNLRVFTVGRLDRDTTGLLIVTNDGHFADKVIHPRSNVEKEYLVKVRQEVTAEHLKKMSRGAWVEGTYCLPVWVQKVRKGTFKIIVKEGKKREVRIITQKAGLDIVELKRIRIGELQLGPIPEGHYRVLQPHERAMLTGEA